MVILSPRYPQVASPSLCVYYFILSLCELW